MICADGLVLTGPGKVVWDGFTNPEEKRNEKTGETFKQFTLSIAIPNNAVECGELDSVLRAELQNGQFKGKFPANGHWGLKPVNPGDYDGKIDGHTIVKGVSYQIKQVYGPDNKILDPMMYQTMLYPGAIVEMLVTPRSYDNVSKGLGFWLQGIRILDATAPRLPVGGVDAGAAFAAAPVAPGYAAPAPGYAPPPQAPAPGYAPPPQAPAPGYAPPPQTPAPGYAPPAPGYAPPAPGYAPPPQAPVTPAPEYIAPPAPAPVHQMTAAAGGATYEQMIANGWTDATLVQYGMMLP